MNRLALVGGGHGDSEHFHQASESWRSRQARWVPLEWLAAAATDDDSVIAHSTERRDRIDWMYPLKCQYIGPVALLIVVSLCDKLHTASVPLSAKI